MEIEYDDEAMCWETELTFLCLSEKIDVTDEWPLPKNNA